MPPTSTKDRELLSRWLPVIGWAALIFFFSAQPNPYGLLPSQVPPAWYEPLGRALHVGEYALLALWCARALAWRVPPAGAHLAMAFGLSALYGCSDELHQRFIPGRSFQAGDLALDFIGAALGLGVFVYLRLRQNRV